MEKEFTLRKLDRLFAQMNENVNLNENRSNFTEWYDYAYLLFKTTFERRETTNKCAAEMAAFENVNKNGDLNAEYAAVSHIYKYLRLNDEWENE